MNTKDRVILILVDGMRPDGLLQCGNPFVPSLLAGSRVFLDAQTVMPSVTLPCHMSLFYSVPPRRHGIRTNTWAPPEKPMDGLLEVLKKNRKTAAMYYNWEELRDLGRPGSLSAGLFLSQKDYPDSDGELTKQAIARMKVGGPNFLFLYLGVTDEVGHKSGWMGKAYLAAVSHAVDCIREVIDNVGENDAVIITADHGGHAWWHGTNKPADITIPIILFGMEAQALMDRPPTILDIAPTVVKFLGVAPNKAWEGRSIR